MAINVRSHAFLSLVYDWLNVYKELKISNKDIAGPFVKDGFLKTVSSSYKVVSLTPRRIREAKVRGSFSLDWKIKIRNNVISVHVRLV